jgi:DNA-directed RNA polymerase specialized sigma subunit
MTILNAAETFDPSAVSSLWGFLSVAVVAVIAPFIKDFLKRKDKKERDVRKSISAISTALNLHVENDIEFKNKHDKNINAISETLSDVQMESKRHLILLGITRENTAVVLTAYAQYKQLGGNGYIDDEVRKYCSRKGIETDGI